MAGLPQVPSTAPPSEDRPSPDALAAAGDVPIFDAEGRQVPFRSLYEVKKNEEGVSEMPGDVLTMIIFIRHFYCSTCQSYVIAISSTIPVNTPNRRVVLIGCGSPTLISKYVSDTGCPFPIYAEPTQKLYSTLGMVKTLNYGEKPKYLSAQGPLGLIKKSVVQVCTWGAPLQGGDIQQVGGEFLFVNGEVGWCHRMKTVRDHVELDELKLVMGLVESEGGK